MSKFCQVFGCPEESGGSFICLTHWMQLPGPLKLEITAANQLRLIAGKLAHQFQMNRSSQTMSIAKDIAYKQIKNRAILHIEDLQQTAPSQLSK